MHGDLYGRNPPEGPDLPFAGPETGDNLVSLYVGNRLAGLSWRREARTPGEKNYPRQNTRPHMPPGKDHSLP